MVEGNRRPIRDRTNWGNIGRAEGGGGGATGVHRICGRIAHKVCFRQRPPLHINLSEGPPHAFAPIPPWISFIRAGLMEDGSATVSFTKKKKTVADSEKYVSLSNHSH